jgi:hypothetical protein
VEHWISVPSPVSRQTRNEFPPVSDIGLEFATPWDLKALTAEVIHRNDNNLALEVYLLKEACSLAWHLQLQLRT